MYLLIYSPRDKVLYHKKKSLERMMFWILKWSCTSNKKESLIEKHIIEAPQNGFQVKKLHSISRFRRQFKTSVTEHKRPNKDFFFLKHKRNLTCTLFKISGIMFSWEHLEGFLMVLYKCKFIPVYMASLDCSTREKNPLKYDVNHCDFNFTKP